MERSSSSISSKSYASAPARPARKRSREAPMKRLTRKLIASLALFAMLGANALPLFAQDKAADKPADAAAPATAAPAAAAPAAAAPATAAPAAAAPAVPKCGDKGFDCNKGDVLLMRTSTAFVLLMSAPRRALFYAGM